MTKSNIKFIEKLESIIKARIKLDHKDSYTSELMHSGTRRIAQKVGEETIELIIAITSGDKDEQIDETADLIYHLLVLLNINGISLEDVSKRLEERHQNN